MSVVACRSAGEEPAGTLASWPGFARHGAGFWRMRSTQDVDGRDEPGHDACLEPASA